MKRIAALTALVLGLVPALALSAAPATALASTSGSVPMSAPAKCPTIVTRPDIPPPCCGPILGAKTARMCQPQTVVFNMRSGSSTATEVRGQRPRVGNALLFRGKLYAVRSVWSDHFNLNLRGKLVVNHGRAIHDGVAVVLRGRPA
jgi:hypothetical protein